jgi:hypothetical protein
MTPKRSYRGLFSNSAIALPERGAQPSSSNRALLGWLLEETPERISSWRIWPPRFATCPINPGGGERREQRNCKEGPYRSILPQTDAQERGCCNRSRGERNCQGPSGGFLVTFDEFLRDPRAVLDHLFGALAAEIGR